jgi:hypothetical protein
MNNQTPIEKDHATRLICAKLYEGGLSWTNKILRGLEREPFVGRSPEIGMDVGLISQHAEKAIKYHLDYAMIAAGLAILGIIAYFFNSMISGIIFAIDVALISMKSKYLDRKIALENFSKKSYNLNYKLEGSTVSQGAGAEVAEQNLIIFGDYYPFIGAGYRMSNWNLVVDTSKPSTTLPSNDSSFPTDFTEKEMYEAVFAEIQSKELPNISHKFLLFADGKELDSTFLLPHIANDKPLSLLDPELVKRCGGGPRCKQAGHVPAAA